MESEYWPANQDGVGYCTDASRSNGVALPWIELSGHRIQNWDDCPPAAALGHISRADQARQPKASEESACNEPARRSAREHFNAAPSSLQLQRFPKPGESIELTNLNRSGYCSFIFPDLVLRAMGEDSSGRRHKPVDLIWDTLVMEPEEDTADLIWRAELPDKAGRLSTITLTSSVGASR
ncbi:hypothetical protein SDC9_184020 [bioreactor metagenome]|uniref:DUF2169 domain-containing protein n=1 Tax=bioreactor metagenome TaxID=1076179 RepID=A0A645HBU3_9ZZZZ